jgi:osmoprotectant transport system ATP-binding protein
MDNVTMTTASSFKPAMIEIAGVAKSYDGGRTRAVADVTLDIRAGALVALIGGSGSGKTTLLKTINRLIEPDRGEIRIDGRPVGSVEAPELRRQIGYVFQGIGLFPHMTVGENISITPQLLGWDAGQIAQRTSELLDLVELPQDHASRFPAELSGGQRQRVGVARALAARPGIVLMDEPFGALDPVTRDSLGQSLRMLHERLGLTTVMVTHDVQEAVLLADEIVVMRHGSVVGRGTPRELMLAGDDAEISAMMAMPKRQAERVGAIMAGETRQAPNV